MWQYSQFLSTSSCRWLTLWGQFPILMTSCPELYPLIRLPEKPLALGRGRIVIPGFIRSPPTIAVYDISHSLPGGRGFPIHWGWDPTAFLIAKKLILKENFYPVLAIYTSNCRQTTFLPRTPKLAQRTRNPGSIIFPGKKLSLNVNRYRHRVTWHQVYYIIKTTLTKKLSRQGIKQRPIVCDSNNTLNQQ